MNITDIIGFIGVTILLVAYLFNLTGHLPSGSILHSIANIVGAGLAGLASVLINYLPFIILESAWTVVALWSLVKALRAAK